MQRIYAESYTVLKYHSNKSLSILLSVVLLAALLRIPFLGTFPPALYSDEVDQGYNAYSVLKTGHDEHNVFLPISFRSFGDWKPPLPTYLMVPMIALFGLNAWGVRLSGAILGVFSVVLMYGITKELLEYQKYIRHVSPISLTASLFLAISPWHIHHSRMAMLTVVALFFWMFGIYSFLKGLKSSRWYIVAAVLFALDIYAYYGMRLVVPLTICGLVAVFWKKIIWNSKKILAGFIIGFIILFPLGISFLQNPDVVLGRAKTVSVFYDEGVNLVLWERITQEGSQTPPKLARFFHNKPTLYTLSIAERFFSHLGGEFLFVSGDKHLPFQLPGMSVLYLIDSVLLFAGLFLVAKIPKIRVLLFGAVFIAILPAALTFLTPAANRSFSVVSVFSIISSIGLWGIIQQANRKKLVSFIFGLCFLVNGMYFVYQYTIVLPKHHADWWLYGSNDIVSYVNKHKDAYTDVVVSGKISMPYIYFLFYSQYEPSKVSEALHRDLTSDRFGFEHVSRFEDVWFPRDFSWDKHARKFGQHTLLITTPEEVVGNQAEKIDEILYPDGKVAYNIYSVTREN